MRESAGQKRRNYRRRLCSYSVGGEDDQEGDETALNENSKAADHREGIQTLKQQLSPSGNDKKSLILDPFIGGVADSTKRTGEEHDLFASPDGVRGGDSGGSVDAATSSTTKLGDAGAAVQNGTRTASGIGFHMLRAMGWTENTGLGQSGKGIVDPIIPPVKAGNLGIGFNATSVFDTQQEAIRQVQKAKREERDRKLKLKLEKAEEAEEEDAFMRESFLALSTNPDWKPLESSSAFVEGATVTHSSKTTPGPRPTEIGCPHCGQRFETKQGLKSHMKTRHAKLLQATKTWFKKQRRRNGSGNHSGKTGTARALAPTKQDFSVYD